MPVTPGSHLGPYRIVELLGSGGMGQVYRAHDTRLDREVAIKVLPDDVANDPVAAARFEREAKAVARLSHPNILSIHDYSCDAGIYYAVTELLEGQTLRSALAKRQIDSHRALEIALSIAEGLAVAHERGVIHRDLKPENIFITRDGRVKILDFGLAATTTPIGGANDATVKFLTQPGTVMGTVGYMAPEQIRGEEATEASDIFAFGCILYELLTAERPFQRSTALGTMAAVLTDAPPPPGGAVSERVRRIVMRCLEKETHARYRSAGELLAALQSSDRHSVSFVTSAARPAIEPAVKRLVVLPFRLLRADPEFEFLSLSLPEAITTSLTKLGSLIVRSSAAAAKFTGGQPDLQAIARDMEVDWLLTGSLLRGGEQLRVSAQLVEAGTSSVLWSHAFETSVTDIFKIQDDLTRHIVESLSIPVNEQDRRNLHRDVPSSALAYELFLRANQQGHSAPQWEIARSLYLQSIDEDPNFAPAHARLARVQWLMAKYTDESEENWTLAEKSLSRALQINPDLPIAHKLYAELETDLGRAGDALSRLLDRVRQRPNDPELHAALVKVCRYCGLLDESLASHRRARELDPKAATSVAHTFIMRGDYDRALENVERRSDIGYLEPLVLSMSGARQAAMKMLRDSLEKVDDNRLRAYLDSLRGALEGDRAAVLDAARRLRPVRDPEALYYTARCLVACGEHEAGLDLLRSIVPGFACVPMFERDPWLDPVRVDTRFAELLATARSAQNLAAEQWRALAPN